MDALNDIEMLVGRVVRTLSTISAKVTRFARWVLLAAVIVCVGSFVLGMAALDGGIESVWVVLGIVFGAVAIGAAATAWWGVRRIGREIPAIAGEVRTMITDGREQAGVIFRDFDLHMHDPADGNEGTGDASSGSAIVVSRRVSGLRDLAGHGMGSAARFSAAVHAITRLPLLVLVTAVITAVFGFLALIFLLALAIG